MPTSGIHLTRQLEQLLPGIVSTRYPRLRFYSGEVVPTLADLQAGAAEVVRETINEVGESDIVADGAFDLPLVEVSADETRYRVLMFGAGFSHTYQQQRALQFSGKETMVDRRKPALAMRAIAERVDNFAAFGDTRLGLTGFMNDAGVTLDNNATNLYTATPDALAEFFLDQISQVSIDTVGTYDALDVVVSHQLYVLLATTRITDGAVTVLDYLLNNMGGIIGTIKWVPQASATRMAGNGGTANKDRIVIYPMERLAGDPDTSLQEQEPEALERHTEPPMILPEEYWQVKGLRRVIPMVMCTTPTMISYPQSMRYVDVPEKV